MNNALFGPSLTEVPTTYPGKMKSGIDSTRFSDLCRGKPPKKKCFIDYCSDLVSQSSVTGVEPLIKSKGWFRKLIKFLILCFGIAGFLVQTHEFLKLFWEFSAISSEEKLSSMKKPAITICNEQPLSRMKFCESWPMRCLALSDGSPEEEEDLYTFYPQLCVDPSDVYRLVPYSGTDLNSEEFSHANVTNAYGFDIERNLLHCKWFSKFPSQNATKDITWNQCGEPKFLRVVTKEKHPVKCYTIKTRDDMLDEELQDDSVLRMILKWTTSDLFVTEYGDKIDQAYWIAIHYSGHVTNPFAKGFRIQESRSYKAEVKQIDTIRLPPPYSTKCYDYVKQWRENQFQGPFGREDCEATCEINVAEEAFGCVPRIIDYPHDKTLCVGYRSIDQELNEKVHTCIKECREACTDTEYMTSLDVTGEISLETAFKTYNSSFVAVIEVYFDSQNSKLIVYKPKYESIELFSYIGGYLGMWLGWSLVALCDFVEIVFHVCKYPFAKIGKARKKTPVKIFLIPPIYKN